MHLIRLPSPETISAVFHRYHRLRHSRPPAVIPAVAFPSPPTPFSFYHPVPPLLVIVQLFPKTNSLFPFLFLSKIKSPFFLRAVGQKFMSTGTNTSAAVPAGAPTTSRRSRSMTFASNRSDKMVGHGSRSPVLPSVLLVPLIVLGLPSRRIAGLATHKLFRMLALVFRLRTVGSHAFLQQSRPAGFDCPRLRYSASGASLLWPAAEHPSNPCSPLKVRMASPPLRSPCARDIWVDPYTGVFDHQRTRVVGPWLAHSRRQRSREP